MPELKLGLNDRIQLGNRKKCENKTIEISDIRFHQCVKLKRFYDERIISFIPPDGEFELMNYRLSTK
jgi:AP-1 complex subunit mu